MAEKLGIEMKRPVGCPLSRCCPLPPTVWRYGYRAQPVRFLLLEQQGERRKERQGGRKKERKEERTFWVVTRIWAQVPCCCCSAYYCAAGWKGNGANDNGVVVVGIEMVLWCASIWTLGMKRDGDRPTTSQQLWQHVPSPGLLVWP